jgi:hypothetical protein
MSVNNNEEILKIKELNLDIIAPRFEKMFDPDQGGSKTVVIGKPGCFTPGTNIMLYSGYLEKVENITINHILMGDDSTPRKVLELCHNYDDMYEIKPSYGESYIVNKLHKLVLKNDNNDILEITVEDYINKYLKNNSNIVKWYIYKNEVNFKKRDILFCDAYNFGHHLANDNYISIKNILNNEQTNEQTNETKELYMLGKIYNIHNDNKYIPIDYLINDKKTRLNLLAGLLDNLDNFNNKKTIFGEYNTNKNIFELKTNNKTLCDNIMYLIQSLGLAVNKKVNIIQYCTREICVDETYYNIEFWGKLDEIPSKKYLFQKKYNNNDYLKTEFDIIHKGYGEYYGFTLDNNHRFLLGSFDVVRNTGKTTLISSLLYSKKHIFPVAMVMSGSEDSNHFFKKLMPNTFVYNSYEEEKIKDFIKRQKLAKSHLEYPWAVLILDDCTDDIRVLNKPIQHALFKKGRHWKMWYILSLQYAMDVKPVIRVNMDGCFILREPSPRIRKVIWENYAGIIPDFQLFCDIMDVITDDYTALYIHNQTQSNNWKECVFWYKADKKSMPDDWRFGCDDFYKFHNSRYNNDYVDPVDI